MSGNQRQYWYPGIDKCLKNSINYGRMSFSSPKAISRKTDWASASGWCKPEGEVNRIECDVILKSANARLLHVNIFYVLRTCEAETLLLILLFSCIHVSSHQKLCVQAQQIRRNQMIF